MNVGGTELRTVPITWAIIGLSLIASHVNYGHVIQIPGSTLGLSHDVIQVDIVVVQIPLSDLLVTDPTAVILLDP